MGSFDLAIPVILENEGGYLLDKDGQTYRGLLEKSNPKWSGWAVLTKKPHPIKNNTIFPELEASARAQYKNNYWNTYFNDIKSQAVTNLMFDARINQTGGYGSMVKRALGSTMPFTLGVAVNAADVAAINKNSDAFYKNFLDQRRQYYLSRNDASNIKGWLNRLAEFPRELSEYAKANKGLLIITVACLLVAGILIFIITRPGQMLTGIKLA